jgi:2-polyprenyl-6-methoxyphenol hydroxylase-like FAD-dependent oxidoreductase
VNAREFDAAVIGAGPGGAACALSAARAGLRVLLVDPRGDAADKPCGEGLMPSGLAALEALGIDFDSSESFAFRRLRFVHAGRDALELELESDARSIARPVLAQNLDRALDRERNVVRVRGHARALAIADGFEIAPTALHGSARFEPARARCLVCADGGGGRSAPSLHGRAPARRSRRFGIRARFELADPLDGVEVHIGSTTRERDVEPADVYLTPLSARTVNVAVLLEREPRGVRGAAALGEWALAQHPRARKRLTRVLTPAAARALDREPAPSVARDDVFLVGDAAGAVDPILGCGVAIALESGIAAARAVGARANGESARTVARRYRAEWRAISVLRRELARALRFSSAHPLLAQNVLALLAAAPPLRRSLCRIVAGSS